MSSAEIVIPQRAGWLSYLLGEGLLPPRRVVEVWEQNLANPNLKPRLRDKLVSGIKRLQKLGVYSTEEGYSGGEIDQIEDIVARYPESTLARSIRTRKGDFYLNLRNTSSSGVTAKVAEALAVSVYPRYVR